MYDTIIIGAGMSGLAAGIRLAHYDQKVVILERHTTIGGLNSFYRLRGRNYDVGLHAVTNFTPKGTKRGPLARLLKQLRIRWDDFALAPQCGSAVAFPNVRLRFDNDFELFRSEVHEHFPEQAAGFERLVAALIDYDDLTEEANKLSARQVLGNYLSDPLLVEMILCPLMYYGGAKEHDMDFGQFCIMFRSIFMEGFARPFQGVRLILKHLVRKYKALGGELRLRAGVNRLLTDGDQVTGVELDDGTVLEGRRVLSSAGVAETYRLLDAANAPGPAAGHLSFVETISVLDCSPADLGYGETIVFFNDHDKFEYAKPRGLVDLRSGVICSPNNFEYDQPLPEGMIRVTALANYDLWQALPEPEYRLEKLRWYDRVSEAAIGFMPDFRGHVVETDMFTPTTIRRFTGHDHGAVYGAPEKILSGTTEKENLFLCGTDQGFLGIVGAIVSGISMANQHCLRP